MGDSPQGKNTNENINNYPKMNENDNKMSLNHENNKETNDTVTSNDETVAAKNTALLYEIMEKYNILDFEKDEDKKRRIGEYDRVYVYDYKYELKEVLPIKILISRKLSETEEEDSTIEKQ